VFEAHRQAPVYFVTFCTHQRKPWLAQPNLHAAFIAFVQRGWNEHRIAVGRFVIMPDHIHLLVSGGPDFDLGGWVRLLKQCLGTAAGPSTGERLWQEGFFDRLIRRNEKLASIWEYLRQNPETAGLSEAPEDWPYQGEFMVLDRV